MNQQLIVLACFFYCTCALDDPRLAKIVDFQLQQEDTGHYFFRFEGSDGTSREEEGNVLDANSEDSPIVVKGSYSYTGDDGKVYSVRYTADENGFHPQGDHIHVPQYVANPAVYQATTPRPPIILQSLRPQYGSFTTTPRPETTPVRIQLPLERRAKPADLADNRLPNSIDALLNREERGFHPAAVNSL